MIQPLQRNNPFRIAYDLPELLEIQRASFHKFLKDGIPEEFLKMTGLRLENSIADVELVINGKEFRLIAPDDTPKDCLLRVKTYSCKLYVQAQMVWRDGAGKCLYQTTPEWVLIGHLPLMTKRGHFIINGSPRIVVHQVVRSPGIYFQEISERDDSKRSRFYGDIIPRRGVWVRLQTTQKGKIEARLKKGKKVSADMLQRCLQIIEKPEYAQSQLASRDISTMPPPPPRTKPASTLWFQAWTERYIRSAFPKRNDTHQLSINQLAGQTLPSHLLEKGLSHLKRPTREVKRVFWKTAQVENIAFIKANSWKGLQSYITNARNSHTKSSYVNTPKNRLPFALNNWKARLSQIDESLPQLPYLTNFATIVSLPGLQKKRCLSSSFYKPYSWHSVLAANISSQSKREWQGRYIRAELMAEDEAFVHTYDKLYRSAEDKEREELASKRQASSLRTRGRRSSSSQTKDWKWGTKRLPDKGFKRERCSKNLWETFKVASRYDLSQLGREKINKKLGIYAFDKQLTSLDIRATSHWLSRLTRGEKSIDDIDHSQNRRIRTSGELLQAQFENGIDRLRKLAWTKLKEVANLPMASLHSPRLSSFDNLKRIRRGDDMHASAQRADGRHGSALSIKETHLQPRLELTSVPFIKKHQKGDNAGILSKNLAKPYSNKAVNVGSVEKDRALLKDILSTKPINGALREFFGGNALSQYMDQTNPLAEITHKRRISSLGVGGVSRESAGMAIRGIHPTHYGRICPIETPEGKNAGLVNSLAFYAKVDKTGSLETPCYKVIKGQVQQELGFSFFSAKRENRDGLHIAPSDLRRSWSNVLATTKVPVRVADNLLDLFTKTNPYKVDCIGISPTQMISVATSLIPFLEHNDANRALMGSNMQRQAVPLMISERPLVGTGLEALVVAESGHLLQARSSGFISYASADKIVVEQLQREESTYLQTYSSPRTVPPALRADPSSRSKRTSPSRLLVVPIHKRRSQRIKLLVKKPTQLREVAHHSWLARLSCTSLARLSCTSLARLSCTSFYRSFLNNRTCIATSLESCSERALFASALQPAKRERCLSLQKTILKRYHQVKKTKSSNWRKGLSFPFSRGKRKRDQKILFLQQPSQKKRVNQLIKGSSLQAGKNITQTLLMPLNQFLRSKQAIRYRKELICERGDTPFKSGSSRGLSCDWSPISHYQFIPRVHRLKGFARSNQNTCLIQKALINEGEWVQQGDVLTDCSASQKGELAVGKNVLIAYLPWEGFNFEDAIVVSERLVKEHVYTSLHIERYDISAQESKESNEWFTNDLPGVSAKSVKHLDDSGLPRIGSFLKEGRVLVGKIKYSNKKPRTPYERLLGDILGDKNLSARDASLYVPRGVEARVIAHTVIETGKKRSIAQSLSSETEHLLSRQLNSSRPSTIREEQVDRSTMPTDTSAPTEGRTNPLEERITDMDPLSERVHPFKEDNLNIDSTIDHKHGLRQSHTQRLRDAKRARSPLDVAMSYRIRQKEAIFSQELRSSNQPNLTTKLSPQRHNITSKRMPRTGLLCDMIHKTGIFSYQPRGELDRETREAGRCHTLSPQKIPKVVHVFLAEKRALQIGDKMSGRHGNKGVVSTLLPTQDMPYLGDGTSIDILLNPLGVPSRMNVGQVYECLLGLAATYLNQHFKLAAFDELYGAEASQSLVYLKLYQARLQSGQNWLFQIDFPGKTRLMDGRSGECFDQWVTVGRAYMLKLIHMVNEKIHARATGPYALITQQPLRGRSKKGGQRLGEMEVWALEGFGAAYTLQELLTKKSDDVIGRKEIAAAILPRPHSVGDTIESSDRVEEKRSVLGHPEIFKVLICELKALCLDVGMYSLTNTSFQRDFVNEAD